MSALSRIPGIAQLASFATFSLQSNPTLRRYNDAFAQAFYHHGRLCASNQATVMVLVIVFVGIISYPAIVTSYNSSIYARQKSASSVLSSRNLSLSSWPAAEYLGSSTRRRRHHEGDLDMFWTNTVIAPTWTQDPDVFNRNLPSSRPLHFMAPVIINATDLLTIRSLNALTEDSTAAQTVPMSEPISEEQLLEYASQIQRRIETMVVEYTTEDGTYLGMNRGIWAAREHQRSPRLVSLRDICVLESLQSQEPQEEDTAKKMYQEKSRCLVHYPWHSSRPSNINQYPPQSTSFVFGSTVFDDDVSQEWKQASLVMSFFLRGDLDGSTPWSRQQYHSRSPESTTEDKDYSRDALDVKRVWHLIFSKLINELRQGAPQNLLRNTQGSSDFVSVVDDDSVQRGDLEYNPEQIQDEDGDNGILPIPRLLDDPQIPFMVRVNPTTDGHQRVSRRLVPVVS